MVVRAVTLKHIFRVAIAAFNKARLFGNRQPDAGMAKATVTAVAGDLAGVNDLGFGGGTCHWQACLLSRAKPAIDQT